MLSACASIPPWTDRRGDRREESTGIKADEPRAKERGLAILRDKLHNRDKGRIEPDRKLLIRDLYERRVKQWRAAGVKSVQGNEYRWRLHIDPFFGAIKACDLTVEDLEDYKIEQQKEFALPATINRELSVIRQCLSLGLRRELIGRAPSFRGVMLKENNARDHYMSEREWAAIMSQKWLRDLPSRTMLMVAYTYGWRWSEVSGMTCQSFDVEQRVLRLNWGETKNKDKREVPITDTNLFNALVACAERKKPNAPLFTREDGSAIRDLRDRWERSAVAAGAAWFVHRPCWIESDSHSSESDGGRQEERSEAESCGLHT